MTTDLATIPQLPGSLELTGPHREAARAVVSGLRDAKAASTRRSYASAWKQFQAWADAGGHPALPAPPQIVALYLGRLPAEGRSLSTIELARAAISHYHAAAGMQKSDNPARHPMVAEAATGWRNRAPAPRQADALARVREVLRLPRRGRGGGQSHPRPPTAGPPWTWPSSESSPTEVSGAPKPPPSTGATWRSGPTAQAASPSRRGITSHSCSDRVHCPGPAGDPAR